MIWYLYLHVNLEETNLSANHCNCWYPSIKLHMISIGYPRIFIHCYSCREYYLLFALFISYQISMTLRANMRSSKKNTKTRKDGIRTGSVVEKKTHPLLLSVFIQLIGDTLSTKRLGFHRYHRLFVQRRDSRLLSISFWMRDWQTETRELSKVRWLIDVKIMLKRVLVNTTDCQRALQIRVMIQGSSSIGKKKLPKSSYKFICGRADIE